MASEFAHKPFGAPALRCKACGASIWPSRGEGPARYSRRIVCSRRCALKLPRKPSHWQDRARLTEYATRAPAGVGQWPVQRVRAWVAAAEGAQRALKRGAGAIACAAWIAKLQEIEHAE
jgi:hypothetical protein